jgi:hypothetical protein
MDFIEENHTNLELLIDNIYNIFIKNPYIQNGTVNSIWIIGEIQKNILIIADLYQNYLRQSNKIDVLYEIIFFVLTRQKIITLINYEQLDELQMLIENKTNLKIILQLLQWTYDKIDTNKDHFIDKTELKNFCCFPCIKK